MSLVISTSAAAASIAYNQAYNAYQDITWSLQYTLCGSAGAQGGFCAFLYGASDLTTGGIGKSLGFAPSQSYTGFTNISGTSGAIIGIALDSLGLFAVSGNGMSTGIDASQAIRNAITIRTGTNFTFLTTFAASAFDSTFTVVQSSAALQQLRFRLTEASNIVEIAQWTGDAYDVWCNVPVSLNLPASAFCRAGFSFAAPLCGNVAAAKFGIANAHFEGSLQQPTQQNVEPSLQCKLPVVSNINVATPTSITIQPSIETLGGAYAPIEPPAPLPDPCDAEPVPTIRCGDRITYNGNQGTFYYYIDAGESTGEFTIAYNSITIPDRFTLTWNGQTATTCFVGDSSYNAQLSALGYGPVVARNSGLLKINKTSSLPRTVELRVDGPLPGTAWYVDVLCIPAPKPQLLLYKGTNTSTANLINDYNSINLGTFNLGQSAQQIFTIKNNGDANLNSLSLVQLLTASFSQYKVGIPITSAVIAPNGSTTFAVNFTPTLTGNNSSRFDLYSNDAESPITFNLSATVLSDIIPLCACNSEIDYSGNQGTFIYNINYGPNVGDINIEYNSFSIPDRFTLNWNGISATTGFVGDSTYNSQLTALGYPSVSSTTSSGILSVAKTSAEPQYATLTVEGPLVGTAWYIKSNCISEPLPVPTSTPIPTFIPPPTPPPTPTYTPTPTPTPTYTPTPTPTYTPTPTPTYTPTPTPTYTPTPTPYTPTPTPTPPYTPTPTPPYTPTPTPPYTPTPTPI